MLVRQSNPGVAIVAEDLQDFGARHRQVFIEHPALKILVASDGGRTAQLLEFRRRLMSDVSPQALLEAIRSAHALNDS